MLCTVILVIIEGLITSISLAAKQINMANRSKINAPELEQFIVATVKLTGRVLGAGAYGSVEEVEIPGATVAAKKLHETLVNLGSPQQVEKWIRDFVEECKLMSQLRHPHIVQFLGVCYLSGAPLPVLLMEKLLTSLDNLLETTPNIPIHLKVHLLMGTSRGLVYLHDHTPPIAHRDLSAKNILVDNGLNAKIADLGVSRIVNIQPGQLAATMTHRPGNALYMPPEADQEKHARYNTGIDIFSFGVVSLFTLTQNFPKNLKPSTYRHPLTRKLIARSEIERRDDYIAPMKTNLGKTHPLVKLTLKCLEYDKEDRPTAVSVLRRLEAVETTLPQTCTQTKVQMMHQIDSIIEEIGRKNDQIKLRNEEIAQKDTQIAQKDTQIAQLQATTDCLQAEKLQLIEQIDTKNDELEKKSWTLSQIKHDKDRFKVENEEQVCNLKKVTTLQQEQLQLLGKEVYRLSSEKEMFQTRFKFNILRQEPLRQPVQVPSSITFKWTKCNDKPRHMAVHSQPVAINEKLYMSGTSNEDGTVLVYTPYIDHWDELIPPPVKCFTVATLKNQLLVIGGQKRFHDKGFTNSILTFDDSSELWVQSLPNMPTALIYPTVVEYQDHLIVAGGWITKDSKTTDVNILDTTTNEWIAVEPLPKADDYNPCLIDNALYLVGRDTKQVLRANVPSLLSRASSGARVWETIDQVPWYQSYPVTVCNILLIVMGKDQPSLRLGNRAAEIVLYNPEKDHWAKCGDLPKPMYCYCATLYSNLFVFERLSSTVYVSSMSITV